LNGSEGFYKKEGLFFKNEYQYGHNNYLGVPLTGRAFRYNLLARTSQKGFPLQSLTLKNTGYEFII